MHSLLVVATLVSSLAICLRLITYRPGPDACHRLGVSCCAWLLIACSGGLAIHVALLGASAQVSVWQLGLLVVLLLVTYRARGNVAQILRVE